LAFLRVVPLRAVFVYSWPIAEISTIQRKAVQRDVPEEETEDEEKKRWLPGGRWREPSPSTVSLRAAVSHHGRGPPLPLYIPADTARCSCFYHYCYYNFGEWTSDEPMRRGPGEIRREREAEEKEEEGREDDPAAARTARSVYARGGPSGEDKMVKKNEQKVVTGRGREDEAPIAGFVVGLLVICSFDIIASELFSA